MNTKFKIYYDDQPNDIIDRIAYKLLKFGLTIVETEPDAGDGYIEYEIVKSLEEEI